MPQAAQLPRTNGFFKQSLIFEETNLAPGSAAAPDKWLLQKKSDFLEKVLPQAAKLPRTSGFFKKHRILIKSSAPGSAADPDKWLGREKATNRCSQGRGAPFGGPGGAGPQNAGRCVPPAYRHLNLSQIYT